MMWILTGCAPGNDSWENVLGIYGNANDLNVAMQRYRDKNYFDLGYQMIKEGD